MHGDLDQAAYAAVARCANSCSRARLRWDSGMRCWPVGSVQRPSVSARLVLGVVAWLQRQHSMWNVVGAGPPMR
ncbi:hypothetical protein XVE_4954 [Xanthomonas vesicatoria ATCC 35937]|uniref:Uncharacterized protein n=1 Tax=Xanthomonas vesicatoria ATCC 35937 TaxID=925775 RepID=F0BKY8_9XANT|nr:hypothetical protein XVE_4954 [Xanthomonas vesicatoria ATCC 35937]